MRGRPGGSVSKTMSEINWECLRLIDRNDMWGIVVKSAGFNGRQWLGWLEVDSECNWLKTLWRNNSNWLRVMGDNWDWLGSIRVNLLITWLEIIIKMTESDIKWGQYRHFAWIARLSFGAENFYMFFIRCSTYVIYTNKPKGERKKENFKGDQKGKW